MLQATLLQKGTKPMFVNGCELLPGESRTVNPADTIEVRLENETRFLRFHPGGLESEKRARAPLADLAPNSMQPTENAAPADPLARSAGCPRIDEGGSDEEDEEEEDDMPLFMLSNSKASLQERATPQSGTAVVGPSHSTPELHPLDPLPHEPAEGEEEEPLVPGQLAIPDAAGAAAGRPGTGGGEQSARHPAAASPAPQSGSNPSNPSRTPEAPPGREDRTPKRQLRSALKKPGIPFQADTPIPAQYASGSPALAGRGVVPPRVGFPPVRLMGGGDPAVRMSQRSSARNRFAFGSRGRKLLAASSARKGTGEGKSSQEPSTPEGVPVDLATDPPSAKPPPVEADVESTPALRSWAFRDADDRRASLEPATREKKRVRFVDSVDFTPSVGAPTPSCDTPSPLTTGGSCAPKLTPLGEEPLPESSPGGPAQGTLADVSQSPCPGAEAEPVAAAEAVAAGGPGGAQSPSAEPAPAPEETLLPAQGGPEVPPPSSAPSESPWSLKPPSNTPVSMSAARDAHAHLDHDLVATRLAEVTAAGGSPSGASDSDGGSDDDPEGETAAMPASPEAAGGGTPTPPPARTPLQEVLSMVDTVDAACGVTPGGLLPEPNLASTRARMMARAAARHARNMELQLRRTAANAILLKKRLLKAKARAKKERGLRQAAEAKLAEREAVCTLEAGVQASAPPAESSDASVQAEGPPAPEAVDAATSTVPPPAVQDAACGTPPAPAVCDAACGGSLFPMADAGTNTEAARLADAAVSTVAPPAMTTTACGTPAPKTADASCATSPAPTAEASCATAPPPEAKDAGCGTDALETAEAACCVTPVPEKRMAESGAGEGVVLPMIDAGCGQTPAPEPHDVACGMTPAPGPNPGTPEPEVAASSPPPCELEHPAAETPQNGSADPAGGSQRQAHRAQSPPTIDSRPRALRAARTRRGAALLAAVQGQPEPEARARQRGRAPQPEAASSEAEGAAAASRKTRHSRGSAMIEQASHRGEGAAAAKEVVASPGGGRSGRPSDPPPPPQGGGEGTPVISAGKSLSAFSGSAAAAAVSAAKSRSLKDHLESEYDFKYDDGPPDDEASAQMTDKSKNVDAGEEQPAGRGKNKRAANQVTAADNTDDDDEQEDSMPLASIGLEQKQSSRSTRSTRQTRQMDSAASKRQKSGKESSDNTAQSGARPQRTTRRTASKPPEPEEPLPPRRSTRRRNAA
uniref:FHA domain-containing protein n=1 Tax=Tetraselmis sp. GSL018 TaxID=582737 RepID=A0A061R7Z0_9CHLO